jgi:tetratricopeptide (TPR) repeat protein
MAVHRKRPLPRYPISGTRLRRRMITLGALLALSSLAPMAAHAQEGPAGTLSGGASAFASGKYEIAVKQLTAALSSDKLSPTDAAKALYVRGLAYQRLNQSPRAIADLGAAMWLGISPSERLSAMVNRSLAYKAAGQKTQADAELALARKADKGGEVDRLLADNGGSTGDTAAIAAFATEVHTEKTAAGGGTASTPARTADAATPGSWTTTTPDAPSGSGGNRVSRWWGSVRGTSNESASAPASGESAKPPTAPPATASAWTTQTQKTGSEEETRVASTAPTAPASTGGGDYRLQLTPTRSEDEAKALWKKVASQNQQLASIEPRIEKTDMGNLGTFYRLQVGPFQDKAESLKLCNALKRSGVDCFLVNP